MENAQWNLETGWRIMLGSEVIPAVLFFILLLFIPESPRWLASKGKIKEATIILETIKWTRKSSNPIKRNTKFF